MYNIYCTCTVESCDKNIPFYSLQTNVLIQDLCNAKSELEKQLQQKSEESLLVYQKVAELTDEKRVLVDIIEHLCVEAGQLIDIV